MLVKKLQIIYFMVIGWSFIIFNVKVYSYWKIIIKRFRKLLMLMLEMLENEVYIITVRIKGNI